MEELFISWTPSTVLSKLTEQDAEQRNRWVDQEIDDPCPPLPHAECSHTRDISQWRLRRRRRCTNGSSNVTSNTGTLRTSRRPPLKPGNGCWTLFEPTSELLRMATEKARRHPTDIPPSSLSNECACGSFMGVAYRVH